MKSPIIKNDKKLKVLRKIYEKDFSKITMNFMALVMKKRREFYLKEIALSFIDRYREYKNIISAKLITAIEISDKVKAKIEDYVHNKSRKNVHLEHFVDKEMIVKVEMIRKDIMSGKIKVHDYMSDNSCPVQ